MTALADLLMATVYCLVPTRARLNVVDAHRAGNLGDSDVTSALGLPDIATVMPSKHRFTTLQQGG